VLIADSFSPLQPSFVVFLKILISPYFAGHRLIEVTLFHLRFTVHGSRFIAFKCISYILLLIIHIHNVQNI
jgi:hypothetical protein